MVKIIQAQYLQQHILRLYFSDNSQGDYDLQPLLDKQTELAQPLNDEQYFKRFFLELGMLCWCNGLELSLGNIHKKTDGTTKITLSRQSGVIILLLFRAQRESKIEGCIRQCLL